MNHLHLFFAGAAIIGPSLHADEPKAVDHYRTIGFYEVPRVVAHKGNDGRLSAQQWAQVPSSDIFYVYWHADPEFSPLRSGLQIAYDDNAIYLRATAHEKAMDRVRSSILKRGHPDLWTDDCFELYFDSRANGVSYLVFTVNSSGVQGDRKQLDAAVTLAEWRGENWRTWASKEKERWVIEATFPFSDLEAKPKAGDLWMFNVVRYAYSSGKFQGASWAPGGSYASPGSFGYLLFGGETAANAEHIANVLMTKARAPWSLNLRDELIRYAGAGVPEIINVKQATQAGLDNYRALLTATGAIAAGDEQAAARLKELEAQLSSYTTASTEDAINSLRLLKPDTAELYALYWRLRIEQLVSRTISRP